MIQVSPFVQLGGVQKVRSIVDRFYDLMDEDPAFARLRAMHQSDLEPMRASLALFLTSWLGGPPVWSQARPDACIMSLHRALAIDAETAGQWVSAMSRALDDTGVEPELAQSLRDLLGRVSTAMITQ